MRADGGILATFARSVHADDEGKAVAAVLYGALEAERQEAGIADIWWYGFSVEMEMSNGEFWAVECLGPNAFHFYPGIVRDETVTWLNLWVAPDLTLQELVGRMDEVGASAREKKNDA